jgi:hypothetical protein
MLVTKLPIITALAGVVATGAAVASDITFAAGQAKGFGPSSPASAAPGLAQPPAGQEVEKERLARRLAEALNEIRALKKMTEGLKAENLHLASQLNDLRSDFDRFKAKAVVPTRLLEREGSGPGTCARKARGTVEIPTERDGVLLMIGTEILRGETVPAERLITLKVDGELKQYRRLKVGDSVEEGQLLAQIDDRLARDDLAIKRNNVAVAETELAAAEITRDEAQARYYIQFIDSTDKRVGGSLHPQEVRAAKLLWMKTAAEVVHQRAVAAAARLELRRAETIQDMYQIRSRSRGVIEAIHVHPGEAVKALSTSVLRLQSPED